MRFCLTLLVLAMAVGCGAKSPATNNFVPLAEVAPELVKVAEKTLPNVKFDSARKIKVNGEDVFEIRGKMPNGKIREVEVSAAGRVVEIE
jgi:hypothetical protein